MKYIKLIIITAFLSTLFSGCSYVSDMVEGRLSKRASFAVTADYIKSSDDVMLTWDTTDTGEDFAGIEIYRSSEPDDEYASYELVASRYANNTNLDSGTTKTYLDTNPPSSGTYFYRVGIIHWDQSPDKRTADNGYTGNTQTDYNNQTDINEISGYGEVLIP